MIQKIQVFPVTKSLDSATGKWSKRPAIPKGEDWHTYQADPRAIARAPNLGVVIPDGIVIVDLDIHKGATREAVEAALGCALDWSGAVQRTVSGGEHYAFALPVGVVVRQGADLLGVRGFDTRASGKGWICTGEGYTDLTLVGLPGALVEEPWPDLPIEAINAINGGAAIKPKFEDELDALAQAVAAQPLDGIGLEEMRFYISRLPADMLESYEPWLKVGMALHHQSGGSAEGLDLWLEWSKGSSHYDPRECRDKWPGFADRGSSPVRFDYVIFKAGGRAVIAPDVADDWIGRAAGVADYESYEVFKRDIKKLSLGDLPKDARQRIAKVLWESYAKAEGITRATVAGALMPSKSRIIADRTSDGDASLPDWAADWVYVEETCEFARVDLDYHIKREAFNAKFDRLAEVQISEKSAAQYCLVDLGMPTVANRMYWPGADRRFEYQGKEMLNAYIEDGVTPAPVIDAEGAAAVDRMLRHFELLIGDDREREIVLDWLTWVYQHPGERVNWALLLQGGQGVGKSYVVSLLQVLLGRHVTNLDASAIAGRFTGWAAGSLVVAVEEVRISGESKYQVLDRIKPFISNSTVQIEEKGRDHRTVPNFSSYLLLTNHRDALPIDDGDRRYCIIFSALQSLEDLKAAVGGDEGAYFEALFGDLRQCGGALAAWFAAREVGAEFRPFGRAPLTAGRLRMVAAAVSPDSDELDDAIEAHRCAVIGDDMIDITYLADLCAAMGQPLPVKRGLAHALMQAGYEMIPQRKIKVAATGKMHRIWTKTGELSETQATAIRSFHRAKIDVF